MKQMRFGVLGKVILSVVLLSFVFGCAALMNTATVKAKRWEGSTLVYQDAVWKLDIKYINKGTKMEGQDGVLFKNGKLVVAKQTNEVIDTSLGALKYYGKRTKASKAWDVTGWNFAAGATSSQYVEVAKKEAVKKAAVKKEAVKKAEPPK